MTRPLRAFVAFLLLIGLCASAEEHPVRPYVDPSQLDCPWPRHSFYKQPWRGFMETRDGDTFLHGIGINYNVPGNDDVAIRLLAESGFKAFRIEIGWGSMSWDEQHLNGEDRTRHLLQLCKKHGIRPTLLLNAHNGVPCPVKFFEKALREDARKGDRKVKLADVEGIVEGRSGLSQLTEYWAAEAIITHFDAQTGECQLSKPLPKDLPRGKPVSLATLKYLPLYPVGTKEFEETASGWVRYADLVASMADAAGIAEFDIELWNELSFGSEFVHATHYFDPPPFTETKDFLHEGGQCWELARRTVQSVKKNRPGVRCIWGFSNTTFFHCPVDQLPPGMDGQSYHPYGTGTRTLPRDETQKDHPDFNLEAYTPAISLRLPEGWADTFVQTESLMRLLNPEARKAHPPGTVRFHHYMTEHGVLPPECGVKDAAGSWDLKTKCALRAYCLWLNKGIDVLEYFSAYDADPNGFGLLPVDMPKLSEDVKWADVATPPMKAVRNLTQQFKDSIPIATPRPLQVEVTELGEPRKIFDGDANHPSLWQRDAFAVLPFQLTEKRFVVALYAMTYDATKPFPEQRYRLALKGLPAMATEVALYDPSSDRTVPIGIERKAEGVIEAEIPVTDSPRVLTITLP